MTHDSRFSSDKIDQLFQAILSLTTVEECYRFFEDLCTVGEITAFAHRWEAARMLAAGATYDDVVRATRMSTATISRIKRFLDYGADGYRLALERLNLEGGQVDDD